MFTLLGLIGLAIVSAQDQQCDFRGGPQDEYELNLTSISRYRLEYREGSNRAYYYTPCRNGEQCQQGTATFYGNIVDYDQNNQCRHYLAIDHRERPSYFFGGASWMFQYNDGELCDQTQQPRQVNVWYQCDEFMQNGAYLYDVDEPTVCRYDAVVRSPLACVDQNRHHANCQWKWTMSNNQSYYLDLSSQNGSVIYDRENRNGYQHFYSPCQNGLHCYQQTGQVKVMSLVENDVTHTCEHYLAVWQEGRVEPIFHLHTDDPSQTHWSFHYWLGEKCTDGTQGEETIRWYCDPSVANSSLVNATYDGDCRWEMNIASSLACPSNDIYHSHHGLKMPTIENGRLRYN